MADRNAALAYAISQLGSPTASQYDHYWESALGRMATAGEKKKAWCGIFALAALHEGGIGLDVLWRIGAGFLLQQPHPLKPLADRSKAQPGDIAYFDQPFQHHAIVESVNGTLLHTIDGNQGSPVPIKRVVRALSKPTAIYSIEPLLVALPSPSAPPGPVKTPSDIQRAVNAFILANALTGAPALLKVDGIFGPKSQAALHWASEKGFRL